MAYSTSALSRSSLPVAQAGGGLKAIRFQRTLLYLASAAVFAALSRHVLAGTADLGPLTRLLLSAMPLVSAASIAFAIATLIGRGAGAPGADAEHRAEAGECGFSSALLMLSLVFSGMILWHLAQPRANVALSVLLAVVFGTVVFGSHLLCARAGRR